MPLAKTRVRGAHGAQQLRKVDPRKQNVKPYLYDSSAEKQRCVHLKGPDEVVLIPNGGRATCQAGLLR